MNESRDAEAAAPGTEASESAGGTDAGVAAPAAAGGSKTGGFLPGGLSGLGRFLRLVWIPLIPGLAAGVVAYALWYAASDRQFSTIMHAVQAQTGWLQGELLQELDVRAQAVDGLARRLAAAPAPNAAAWDSLASGLLSRGYQFRAIAWMDTSLSFVRGVPTEERYLSLLDPKDDDLRRMALYDGLAGAPPHPGAVITPSVALTTGGRQILICAPVRSRGRPTGYVVAVMRVRDLLDALLKPAFARGYSVTVYEGPYLLYGPMWGQGGAEEQYAHDADVRIGALLWRVQLWPSEERARALESWAPVTILVLGLIAALLTSVLVYLVRASRAEPRAD